MKIITLFPHGFGSNTYILTSDNKTAVVIDPSSPRVKDKLFQLQLVPAHVILTHCHFDHVYGVPALQAAGATVHIGEKEKPLVGTGAVLSALFGAAEPNYSVDETFSDGQEKTLCGIKIKALHTAGHTAGGVTYLITDEKDEKGEKHLFTGDVLFDGSIGRTDFPTGDLAALRNSLRRIRDLEGDYPLYSGHGDQTTLQTQRKTNPFLLDL